MIIQGNRKPLVAAILGPRKEEKKMEEGSKGESSELHACMQEFSEAHEAKDIAGMAAAFKAAIACAKSESNEEAPHEE